MLHPQHLTESSSSTAHVCAAPALALIILAVRPVPRSTTGRLSSISPGPSPRCEVSPYPSWPYKLSPQHLITPPYKMAHEYAPPRLNLCASTWAVAHARSIPTIRPHRGGARRERGAATPRLASRMARESEETRRRLETRETLRVHTREIEKRAGQKRARVRQKRRSARRDRRRRAGLHSPARARALRFASRWKTAAKPGTPKST